MANSRKSNSSHLQRQVVQYLNDLDGRTQSIATFYMKKDSGNGGIAFPDGQLITGNQYLYDSLEQDSNYIWIQDENVTDLGGFVLMDYDLTSTIPPTTANVISAFGLIENPNQAGVKEAGVVFNSPDYTPTIASNYEGNVTFQTLRLPKGPSVPNWQWPLVDGPAGASLSTNGSGGLYWTDPPNPPTEIVDTDATDFLITASPAWGLAPVSVVASQNSTPAQVSFDVSLFTLNNNQTIYVRMLVNGVTEGAIYNKQMPRNSIVNEHYTWSPILTAGETVTIELQSVGGQDCFVYGASGAITTLTLLEPGGVVLSANAQGTANVISPTEFWSRWETGALENLAKLLTHNPIPATGIPSWLNVARANIFISRYSADNINLLNPVTISNINELVTLGVLTPAQASIILAT